MSKIANDVTPDPSIGLGHDQFLSLESRPGLVWFMFDANTIGYFKDLIVTPLINLSISILFPKSESFSEKSVPFSVTVTFSTYNKCRSSLDF